MAMLFAGDDFSAKVTNHNFLSADTSKVVSGLSWEPNLFFAVSNEGRIDDSTYSSGSLSFGIALSATVRFCYTFFDDNNETEASVSGLLSNAGIIDSITDNQTYNITPASGGYTITRTGDNGIRDITVMACRIDNAEISLALGDTPTSTGEVTYTTGFEPSIAMLLSTMLESINTEVGISDANSFSIGVFTDSAAHSMAVVDEDNVATMSAESIYAAKTSIMREAVGTDSLSSDFAEFTSTGVTLDYDTVLGTARKQVLLAIEAVTNASISVDFTGTPTSGNAPLEVVFSGTATPTNTTVTTHAWAFGDGGTATTEDPTHEYTAAGTYSVTYTASDGVVSGSKTRTSYITVTDPPPDPPSISKVVGGAYTSSTGKLAVRGGGIEVEI
jgi:PKD repeat protein